MIIIDPDSELGPKAIGAHTGPSTSNHQYEHGQEHEATSTPNYPGVLPSPQQPQRPPPAFAPYAAEWFQVGNGDVISHDEHLNTDGEALYRFLLTQASERPPSYRIRCKGSHTETRYRWVTSHDSDHYAHLRHHRNSDPSTRTESYTEHVTDFDFYINVTPPFLPSTPVSLSPSLPLSDVKAFTGQPAEQDEPSQHDLLPLHWSVADDEPVYRGKMVRQLQVGGNSPRRVSLPDGDLPLLSPSSSTTAPIHLRTATRRERQDYSHWVDQRTRKGLPPWVSGINSWNLTIPTSRHVLKSSRSIRQWADEYCASPKLLKEFVYTKVLYGWDISQLESAIRSTIALAPYHGEVEVTFTPINSNIYIRPSNRLSRALSNVWLKFLSVILFIFPFIWLFKRFHPKGGGRWQVCGSAYALKKLIPVSGASTLPGNELPSYEDAAGPSTLASSPPSTILQSPTLTSVTSSSFPMPNSTSSAPTSALPSTRIFQTPQGPHKLIGQREGEWFRHWEPIILRSVLTRYQCTTPLTSHTELYGRYPAPGNALEGYHDTPSLVTRPIPIGRGDIYLP